MGIDNRLFVCFWFSLLVRECDELDATLVKSKIRWKLLAKTDWRVQLVRGKVFPVDEAATPQRNGRLVGMGGWWIGAFVVWVPE